MPSWWGKSSSKDVKKEANNKSFLERIRKFKILSEEKWNNRSKGSRKTNIPPKGSQSESPSAQVSRCQSFNERPQAQPLPLPRLRRNSMQPNDHLSRKQSSRPFPPLPLPKLGYVQTGPYSAEVETDIATGSITSESSVDSDDPSDSHLLSLQASDYEYGNKMAMNSPSSGSGEMCAMKEVTLLSDDAKSKESAQQLGQEIALLSRLRHPNIVQYYGSETVDDKLYIYLEYVSGGSIYKILQDYGQLGEVAIRSYTKQILSGLAYLHEKNTVHRDIKGANILVDPNGRVKLADFGMAKHISGYSCPLSFKGSPYWMAPEVIKNSSGCNLAVDIWSLGCTVLEMATTKPPWSQYEGIAAMFKIGNSKELPVIPGHLSDEAKDFIRQCLQRDPTTRPTAAKLLDHPFVRNAATLERPINSPDPPSEAISSVAKSIRSQGFGHARNFLYLDSEGVYMHQSRGQRIGKAHMPRNMSCPVSPIGSPLLHSRSPQHQSGRLSPSPISSPQAMSGSSTPLTGGPGSIPLYNNPMSPPTTIFRSQNNLYHRDPKPDIFKGIPQASPLFRDPSENGFVVNNNFYDGQSVLSNRVSQQLLKEHVKLNQSLDLNLSSPVLTRNNVV